MPGKGGALHGRQKTSAGEMTMDMTQGNKTPFGDRTYTLLELVTALPLVAAALRKEGLSEGRIHAALLAICGVKVDSDLVRHLTGPLQFG
jgi:hypothetical protein